ncbi:phosphoribosylformylglycinamidine synthase subunit PurQ [Nisaea nitritireducens]|uniref:phosphoribosylformylglycinamidine synthase subunit PurQ n=1 Tax=Nisaea nitritireducens TaxID=568392 RepID=UPI0018676B9A|nr:phosphoribosylformylglycinamidine synthase subunit PurQ [Nisaea nitritireducens]
MKSAIIVFPGTNRERDMAIALEKASGTAPLMVWHKDSEIPDVDLIVVPGGFSYGDYLRAGAMAAHSPVLRSLKEKASKGTPVMGVCNGFQVLTETGLLPGVLMRNAGLKFICRNVGLKVETSQSLFTGGYEDGQVLSIPVAHNDGNYFADNETLDRIEQNGQVAFRYVDEDGAMTEAGNPNGSARNIAGVFNKEKTVLGFMPHPENAIDPAVGGTDGRGLFDGLVRALS